MIVFKIHLENFFIASFSMVDSTKTVCNILERYIIYIYKENIFRLITVRWLM